MTGSRLVPTALAALIALSAAGPAFAQQPASPQPGAATSGPTHAATLVDRSGNRVGAVTLAQYPAGVFLRGELQGLPPGWHGFHIHDKGACTPNFDAAGPHFNPGGAGHGMDGSPMHAGDLPNIFVHADGTARFEFMSTNVSLTSGAANLMDQDGSALVLHADPDDYVTDPSGNSGGRIACGVIQKG